MKNWVERCREKLGRKVIRETDENNMMQKLGREIKSKAGKRNISKKVGRRIKREKV